MNVNKSLMQRVAYEIFSQTAYVAPFAEPEPAPPAPREKAVRATVRFQGSFAGSLALEVPRTLLPVLASNMLGVDENDPVASYQGQDALGELTNIICGNLLSRMAGPGPIFHLKAPKVEHISGLTASDIWTGNATQADLALETGMASLILILD